MARLANLAKMAPRITAEQVYDDLHGRIVRGDLRPGDALSETRVAESVGLSRTPVREAFWRLAEIGFVRVVPQVGTFVAPINVQAVRDNQFIRETLECRAIGQAAALAGPEDLAELRDGLAQQDRAMADGDFAAFFALDEAMHRSLMLIAGHPFIWPVIMGAKAQLDRVRFLSLGEPGWPGMIMAQHHDLVACLAAHDAAAATRVMTAHLRTAFAAIDRIAATHPDFFDGALPSKS